VKDFEIDFIASVRTVAKDIHNNSRKKGFWPKNTNIGEKLALVHSEISEALEAVRDNTKPDKYCPNHSNFSVELADAVIRIFDIADEFNLNLGQIILDKHAFNKTRPHKHNRKF
jgi:NTP pyrophosphatase (non-canonical NTP hydrolase)